MLHSMRYPYRKDTQEDILTTNHLLNKQKESKGKFGLKITGEIKTPPLRVWGGKNLTISRNIPFIPQGRYVSFLDGDFGLVSIQSLQVRTWDFNRWISWTGEKSSTWKMFMLCIYIYYWYFVIQLNAMCFHRYILSRYQIMFLSYHSVQLNYFVTLSLTISLGKNLPSFKYFRIFPM